METTATENHETASPAKRRLERLAWVLDSAIPLPGGFRLGLDSIAGLLPGVGDGATALISTYIMAEGMRAGASKSVLVRMLGNVAVDTLVGAIPLVGDIFDVGFRSNVRNVDLLTDYLDQPAETSRTSGWLLLFIMLCLIAVLVSGLMLVVVLVRSMIGLF